MDILGEYQSVNVRGAISLGPVRHKASQRETKIIFFVFFFPFDIKHSTHKWDFIFLVCICICVYVYLIFRNYMWVSLADSISTLYSYS